jgi:Flp pilus assembly protein TadG
MRNRAPPWRFLARGRRHAILGPSPRTGLARAQQATTAVEFAVCALAMVLMVVGFVEFGRLAWTFEVLQDVASEGARCMGLGANSCAAAGAYSASNTTGYIVSLATTRGVPITAAAVALNNAATCGGAGGFSEVTITYDFTTVAPTLLTSLVNGFSVPASACFPKHS